MLSIRNAQGCQNPGFEKWARQGLQVLHNRATGWRVGSARARWAQGLLAWLEAVTGWGDVSLYGQPCWENLVFAWGDYCLECCLAFRLNRV
jgi:hypothetical protein